MAGLFGTDGIRGRANEDLTPILAFNLGRALGYYLGDGAREVVIGRDTRRSGEMLSAAVGAGLASVGADVVDLGVVTTPCLAFAAEHGGYVAGVMVSASHNPADDNGLKVVSGGRKMDDAAEEQLEHLLLRAESLPRPTNDGLGRIRRDGAGVTAYRDHLVRRAEDALVGLRIAVDCANGSASGFAPDLFRQLGAEVTVLGDAPNGSNINAGGGSTDPGPLAAAVVAGGLDLGLAWDGDADRLIAAGERGDIIDGDGIMGICAIARLRAGTLPNGVLVASVMSNGGLERAIRDAGGELLRAPVGDRHVLEAMERSGAMLGGEQSGHVIFRDVANTGDGLLTAIELVRTLRASGSSSLSELAAAVPRLPQVVINSAVRHKDQWQIDPEFVAAVTQAEDQLAGRGRVLVRASGTEPRLRIMVEGDAEDEIAAIAQALGELATHRLN